MHKNKRCYMGAGRPANHNGNFEIAQRLIECAAEAKADYIS